jgi:hypothetical protein
MNVVPEFRARGLNGGGVAFKFRIPNSEFRIRPSLLGIVLPLLALLAPPSATAVPYASGLSNFNGTVFFRLNESADNVKVIYNSEFRIPNSEVAITNDLGALPAGLANVALGVSGVFQVVVFKAAPAGFITPVAPNRGAVLPISPATTTTRFFSPRGLAVNHNPSSPYFGRIYVANATSGTVSNGFSGSPRAVGDGLYLLNSDFTDALGQGDEPLTGGLDFTAGLDLAPYRLSVGQDDNVYVCDFSETNGGLYVVNADVAPGSGTNVLGGPADGSFPVGNSRIHGSIAAAVVEGSLAASNLVAYVIDEDLQTDRADPVRQMQNSLWQHNLFGTLPGAPYDFPILLVHSPWVGFAGQIMDLSRGSNGLFYVNDYRSPGVDWAGLYVHEPLGAALWNSLAATRAYLNDNTAPDLLRATGGGAVSPHGDVAAVINLEDNSITVLPLIDGLPDLTNRLVFQGFSVTDGQGRDVAFDAAGNLYAISSGARKLCAFSPGGRTTTITGSDGSFQLVRPPGVRVTATVPDASEGGPSGVFSIQRTGDMANDLSVSFGLSGSAERGADFVLDSLTATIPAGASSVDVVIPPVDNSIAEPAETLTLTLLGSADYDLRSPISATMTIVDNDPDVVRVSAVDSNAYERLPMDTMTFLIERDGQTNTDLFVNFTTTAGTATRGIDFSVLNNGGLSSQIYFAPGQVSEMLTVAPIDDTVFEGNETVAVTILPGNLYTPAEGNTAFGTIVDDESPPVAVLFADDFDTDTSPNWVACFGANNGIYDAEVKWAFDYGALGIPPAIHSASNTTVGLFVQVNKTNAAPGGSAGINFYPAGRSFSGDYLLRFDMLLGFGVTAPTEHALAGLNHSGRLTNRVTQSTDKNGTTRGGDGVFVAMASDGSNKRDWTAYTVPDTTSVPSILVSRTAASLADVITAPPYSVPGSPGVGPTTPRAWSEVELGQSNNVVTLKVNNAVIFSFTNTSAFSDGNIMIGLNDQFDSIGSGGANGNFVIFDNVRVVTPGIYITAVQETGNAMQIDFVAPDGQPSDFRLQSTASLWPAVWADDNSSVIIRTAEGFRCMVTRSGESRFYRLRR